MAAYVNALKSMRKQLSNQEDTPPEVATPSTSGLVSRLQQSAKSQTQEQAQVNYSPNNFALNAIKSIRSTRGQMTAKLFEAASRDKAQIEHANRALESASKRVEKKAPVQEEVTPEEPTGNKLVLRPNTTDRKLSYGSSQLPGNADVISDTPFIEKTKAIANKYGINPAHLLSLMHFETGGSFDPGQKNAGGSSATGLIQFMDSTAKNLGTDTKALSQMSRLEQLDYVDKYLGGTKIAKMKNPTASDLYAAVLWPAAVGRADRSILWTEGTKEYAANKGLDVGAKGYITKEDAARKAMQYIDAYGDI